MEPGGSSLMQGMVQRKAFICVCGEYFIEKGVDVCLEMLYNNFLSASDVMISRFTAGADVCIAGWSSR